VIRSARYAHTNLVGRDWRRLVDSHASTFAYVLVPPERDYTGPALEAGTGISGAAVRGAHLRLPGHGDRGPTLEIFSGCAGTASDTSSITAPSTAADAAALLTAFGQSPGDLDFTRFLNERARK
jgi:hypothetical protein